MGFGELVVPVGSEPDPGQRSLLGGEELSRGHGSKHQVALLTCNQSQFQRNWCVNQFGGSVFCQVFRNMKEAYSRAQGHDLQASGSLVIANHHLE